MAKQSALALKNKIMDELEMTFKKGLNEARRRFEAQPRVKELRNIIENGEKLLEEAQKSAIANRKEPDEKYLGKIREGMNKAEQELNAIWEATEEKFLMGAKDLLDEFKASGISGADASAEKLEGYLEEFLKKGSRSWEKQEWSDLEKEIDKIIIPSFTEEIGESEEEENKEEKENKKKRK
jgi:hypothetical protein